MIEDKLSHTERVRLECVAQSVAMLVGGGTLRAEPPSAAQVVQAARQLESYVLGRSDPRPLG